MHHSDARQLEARELADTKADAVTTGVVVAALAGLAAAWVAAGSTGLLAHPLRRALTLLLLGVAVLAEIPVRKARLKSDLLLLLLALGAAACVVTLSVPAANILAVAGILGFLAFAAAGHRRNVLLASATAVAAFGLYRFAVTSVPWLWLAADTVGSGLGQGAGRLAGRPVRVGATFAGLDFLILTGLTWGLYLPYTKPPRAKRALYGFGALLGGHLIYLLVLAYVPDLLALAPLPAEGAGEPAPPVRFFHHALPWNLPILACGIHLLMVAAMLRWSARADDIERPSAALGARPRAHLALEAAAGLTAILLPVVATLYPGPSSLAGQKIVFYEKGFLNWLKPVHDSYGRLSSGMYGMLPIFLESLGAKPLVSADLSETDLQDAAALVLLFPDEPWREGQLDRIYAFVRRGGALLVFGEHTTQDQNGSNRFNEVLAPTALRVRFDSATFAIGGWLDSYEALSHPATAGIRDDQNQFGVVIGASVDARWPARPLLVGRWGWTDDGDVASPRAMMGNDRYDPGEKLGDLVLAAEQPLGKGRVLAFGDTSGMTNAINVSSYVFTSRLLAYLAGGPRAHGAARQIVALLASAVLIGLLCYRPATRKTVLVALGLTASLVVCGAASQRGTALLPDGRRKNPNNLAYIDASHVEAYSSESWRPEGVGGLALTLMRNGYLTLTLPELTPERLERAGLLVSIAPSRPFSHVEVETVKTFVNNGGILMMTVGYEEAGPSQPLLEAFGLRVGPTGSETREPEALGHFKSPYLESGGKRVYVRFHAGWPVACTDASAHVIAYGRDNSPMIVTRRTGKGVVLLVGDTCFAMNKNLEYENGAPFEGLRENADFWRWVLTVLRNEPMWIPPALRSGPPETPAAGEAKP